MRSRRLLPPILAALIALALVLLLAPGDDEGTVPERPAAGDAVREPPAPPTAPDPDRESARSPGRPPAPAHAGTETTGAAILPPGESLEGIAIRIARYRSPGDTAETPNWFETVTGPDGSFRVDGLLPGRYGLIARREGLPPQRLEFDVPAEGRAERLLIRYEGSGILVRVRNADGGVPDRKVTIGGGRETVRGGRTGPDGEVLFANVEQGRYYVYLERSERELHPRHRLVRVEAGRLVRVEFGGSCRITGTVRAPDGTLLGAANVHVMNRFGHGRRWAAGSRPDERGRFEIDAVPPGEYDVTVQRIGPRMCVAPVGRIELRPGETRDLDLRLTATILSGIVTRADTGEALRSGQVDLSVTPVRGKEAIGWGLVGSTDGEGRFEYVGLPPGTYLLRVSPNWQPLEEARITVALPESGHRDGIHVKLPPRHE